MPENENYQFSEIKKSENEFSLMSTNDLLKAYDSNKDFPATKTKIRQEILRRMNIGASIKPK